MSEKGLVTRPAPRDAAGRLIAEDGLPAHGHARAAAIAKIGKASDPLGLVAADLIALYQPAIAMKPSERSEARASARPKPPARSAE